MIILLVIAVIKTLSTNIGFSLGWRGGKIFPSIFASVAVGAAIAQFSLQNAPRSLPGAGHGSTDRASRGRARSWIRRGRGRRV